jgi:hypothetical protein
MLLPFARLCKQYAFSQKLLVFFIISFNQANDVYVKIYETVQLTVLRFLNQISTLTLECIVGCIFKSVVLIITREIPCISMIL